MKTGLAHHTPPHTIGRGTVVYASCAKRLLDVSVAVLATLALLPVFAVVTLVVVLDDGWPVSFSQERLGKGGRKFRMYKFRTMKLGSDRGSPLNPDGSLRTEEDDPRITRAGKILRRYSLDELPQLVNVVKGDMSLVGPRPDLPLHAGFYSDEERRKLDLRPGMTGLAQVSGRNSLPWKRRLQLDVEYVNRASFWLDLKILARTAARIISGRGVYSESRQPSPTALGGSSQSQRRR